jgi:hypothetical protein
MHGPRAHETQQRALYSLAHWAYTRRVIALAHGLLGLRHMLLL